MSRFDVGIMSNCKKYIKLIPQSIILFFVCEYVCCVFLFCFVFVLFLFFVSCFLFVCLFFFLLCLFICFLGGPEALESSKYVDK